MPGTATALYPKSKTVVFHNIGCQPSKVPRQLFLSVTKTLYATAAPSVCPKPCCTPQTARSMRFSVSPAFLVLLYAGPSVKPPTSPPAPLDGSPHHSPTQISGPPAFAVPRIARQPLCVCSSSYTGASSFATAFFTLVRPHFSPAHPLIGLETTRPPHPRAAARSAM
ncbi:hypothetical protein C8J57DRAFT_1516889 [Mycena rebaudengoi]|nr:hypothetical protein C8J57DRAFT_1516889 [Mycena rebaudengoi]